MMKNRLSIVGATAILLCGCSAHMDMHGTDPVNYYAKHPIQNTVETHTLTQTVHFAHGGQELDEDTFDHMHLALHDVSSQAVDAVHIKLSAGDMRDEARRTHLIRLMHSLGYNRDKLHFEASNTLLGDTAEINVAYLAIVPPRCPDWRTSPVTSYSNTHQGNFECAQQVNLGLMVADPHDLVRGTGDVAPDTQSATQVIEDYHAGKDFSASSQSNSSSNGSSGSGSSGTSSAVSAVASGVSGMAGGQ